jgi:hypothetical protein
VKPQTLDPTLAAVLPLVGVVVGALLAVVARHFLDARSEQRQFERTAAAARREVLGAYRVIVDDFDRIDGVLRSLLRAPQDRPLRVRASDASLLAGLLDPAGWREVKLLLAREVTVDDWIDLRQAAVQCSMVATEIVLKQDFEVTFSELRPKIETAIRAVRKGRSKAMAGLGY